LWVRRLLATTSAFIHQTQSSDDLRRPNIISLLEENQNLPLGKALMLVLKQPGDDIRAAALGDLDGDQ